MDRLHAVLGRRVRELRDAKDWTQEELARRAKLAAKHVGAIERGDKPASLDAIERLAKALGAEYYELFLPADSPSSGVEDEIAKLLKDRESIDTGAITEFLQGLRAALRKLDRHRPSPQRH
jgi:transcriptional regulator with XRE-family HTH domain